MLLNITVFRCLLVFFQWYYIELDLNRSHSVYPISNKGSDQCDQGGYHIVCRVLYSGHIVCIA